MKAAILALVLLSGCATMSDIRDHGIDRVGAGIELAQDGYHDLCSPELALALENLKTVDATEIRVRLARGCAKAKLGLNGAVDGYTAVNDWVKGLQ